LIENLMQECKECKCEESLKPSLCAICFSQRMLRGKWKIVIIYLLKDNCLRFSQLKKSLPKVTQAYLSKQLKELESVNLIRRYSYNEVPPRVEYSLTEEGQGLIKVIDSISAWGKDYLKTIVKDKKLNGSVD